MGSKRERTLFRNIGKATYPENMKDVGRRLFEIQPISLFTFSFKMVLEASGHAFTLLYWLYLKQKMTDFYRIHIYCQL